MVLGETLQAAENSARPLPAANSLILQNHPVTMRTQISRQHFFQILTFWNCHFLALTATQCKFILHILRYIAASSATETQRIVLASRYRGTSAECYGAPWLATLSDESNRL